MTEWLKQNKYGSDETAWMHGAYVARAIGAVMSKNSKYPDNPLDFFGVRGNLTDDGEAYALTDADRFGMFVANFNRTHKEVFEQVDGEFTDVIDVD